MGVTGSGKTFTMANVIQRVQQPDAGPLAQQDAGRPALRRVQGVLSAQRGPLLRQLLRLLPARSLHSAARHLHREGRLDQRGDRPPAAGGDQRAGQPPGRDHRGQRLVHLRLGLAGGLQGDDGRRCAWARRSTATRCCASWSTFSTTATTSSSSAASSASAATASRSGRRTRSSPSASSSGATRSSSSRSSTRSAAKSIDTRARAVHLPGQALRACPRSGSPTAIDAIKQELDERLEDAPRARASCSKPSGSTPARGSTSR